MLPLPTRRSLNKRWAQLKRSAIAKKAELLESQKRETDNEDIHIQVR